MTDQGELLRKVEIKLTDAKAILELADAAWVAGHEVPCDQFHAVINASLPKIRSALEQLDTLPRGES